MFAHLGSASRSRIARWHVRVGFLAITAHVAETRKRNVRAADEVAIVRRVRELAPMLTLRRRAIHVVADRDRGIIELHGSHMDDVAPEQELLALALEHVHG